MLRALLYNYLPTPRVDILGEREDLAVVRRMGDERERWLQVPRGTREEEEVLQNTRKTILGLGWR